MTPPLAAVMLWAGLLALLYLALAVPIARARMRERVPLGDGGNTRLRQAIRVHGNFGEYVPIALILMTLAAMAGWGALYLHALGGTLFLARIFHAVGLSCSERESVGRFVGTLFTWIVIAAAAVLCLVPALGLR